MRIPADIHAGIREKTMIPGGRSVITIPVGRQDTPPDIRMSTTNMERKIRTMMRSLIWIWTWTGTRDLTPAAVQGRRAEKRSRDARIITPARTRSGKVPAGEKTRKVTCGRIQPGGEHREPESAKKRSVWLRFSPLLWHSSSPEAW